MLVLTWTPTAPAPSSHRPVGFLAPPGPALLEQNLAQVQVVSDPSRRELERIARSGGPIHALFDLPTMPRAVAAARHLRLRGTAVIAVRGRTVPASVGDAFSQLYLGDRFADLLAESATGLAWPARWRHPVLSADVVRAGGRSERLGVIFSRLPEPGILDVPDLGRAGIREGAVAGTLGTARGREAIDVEADAIPSILAELRRAGRSRVLLVDLGGEVERLALALARAGVLGGFFGQARSAIPPPILAAGVPLYTWFEVEDVPRTVVPAACHGCAYVPVALPGERPTDADARVASVRAAGYSAIVPRHHLPVPATAEWERIAVRFPVRHRPGEPLDGTGPIFALPGWDAAAAPRRLAAWQAGNRWPEAPPTAAPLTPYSLASLRIVLDGILHDARGGAPDHHARDLFAELRGALGPGPFEAGEAYPFLAWNGESLLAVVNRAVAARMQSLTDIPDALTRAVRHTTLAGGKRIRPILALAVAGACGVGPATALPAALALEWLHTASLIQDDLPSMDDDPVRRRVASAHVRHGEGMALLASDALVALAFADLARLADDAAVGPRKASTLIAAVAREMGAAGVVGGQARDLLARDTPRIDLAVLLDIHRRKTAPLFRLAATVGAVLGDASAGDRRRLEAQLADLGVAFQIVDDLLDADDGDARAFGRRPGSDARQRRRTFATALCDDAARTLAATLVAPLTSVTRGPTALLALAKVAGFVLSRRG